MTQKVRLLDSGWKFVTSEGANIGITAFDLGIVGNTGRIFIAPQNAPKEPYELKFISGGLGLSLAPVSMDFATKSMYSAGVLYSNPLIKGCLTLEDLKGACIIYSASVHDGDGISLTLILIGVGLGIVKGFFAAASGFAFPLAPLVVLSSCHAMVFFYGDLLGTPDLGLSATLGYITYPDTMKNKLAGTIRLAHSINDINKAL